MVSADAYKSYAKRARRAVLDNRFPPEILDKIERDLNDTLPTLKLFTSGSPLREDLRELLCAWVVCRSDEGLGYVSQLDGYETAFKELLPALDRADGNSGAFYPPSRSNASPHISTVLCFPIPRQPAFTPLHPRLLHPNDRRDRSVLPSIRESPSRHFP